MSSSRSSASLRWVTPADHLRAGLSKPSSISSSRDPGSDGTATGPLGLHAARRQPACLSPIRCLGRSASTWETDANARLKPRMATAGRSKATALPVFRCSPHISGVALNGRQRSATCRHPQGREIRRVEDRIRNARDSLPGMRDALPKGELGGVPTDPQGDENREPLAGAPTSPPR